MKIKCPHCGEKVNKDAKFCMQCGKAIDMSKSNSETFAGKRVKCPNCGENLKAFSAFCPTCGFEIRADQRESAAKELMKQLDLLNTQRDGVIRSIKNTLTKKSLFEQKFSLISSFVVPNTREDVLEVMILAVSNINVDVYSLLNNNSSYKERMRQENDRALNDAWNSIYEQALDKARLLKLDENEIARIEGMYKEKKKKISLKKNLIWYVLAGMIIIPSVIALFVGLIQLIFT